MPSLNEVIKAIETVAPPSLAEEWDNSGLQVGDRSSEIKKVMAALDPLPGVIREAAGKGADLVVTHHPLFFADIRSLDASSGTGESATLAIRAGVAVYSAHTSADCANPGVSDALAGIFGLARTRPIEPSPSGPVNCGLGRIGALRRAKTAGELAGIAKAALGVDGVRLIGDPGKKIKTVAVCGGSGASLIEKAALLGAELYLTGDIKYHDALKAAELGLAVIDAGHYATEKFFIPSFAGMLKDAFGKKKWRIEVEVSGYQGEPWSNL